MLMQAFFSSKSMVRDPKIKKCRSVFPTVDSKKIEATHLLKAIAEIYVQWHGQWGSDS